MAKTEKHFDQQLEKARLEATDKKEKTNMKKESIKTWTIVILVAVIAGIVLYQYAFSQGYAAKQSDTARISQAVQEQVSQLKTK